MSPPPWIDALDWDAVADEAIEILQRLLRVDTTNPPGNERAACDVLAAILAEAGIEHELFDVAPGRANLVARVPGRGELDPILLSAHLDVVPAEGEWTHPPFGGEIHDGYVWGRGAVDMKNMAAMEVACLLALHRHALDELRCDVIFAAVADEEAGCELGSLWLAREHPDRVRARYAIGEVGGFTAYVGEARICPVQVAEKGVCWLRVRADAEGGHGSIPVPDSAVERIARAAQALACARTPLRVTPVMENFVHQVAALQPFPRNVVLRAVLNPLFSRFVIERVLPDRRQARLFHALLHNTATPTVLRAGGEVNVIPARAELRVDGRTLPGQGADDLLAEVRGAIGEGYEVEVIRAMDGVDGDVADPIIGIIQEVLDELDPGLVVVPNLLTGFTDAKAWASLGATCIGFSPLALGPDESFIELFHGVDERVPVKGFRFGIRALTEVVGRLVS